MREGEREREEGGERGERERGRERRRGKEEERERRERREGEPELGLEIFKYFFLLCKFIICYNLRSFLLIKGK